MAEPSQTPPGPTPPASGPPNPPQVPPPSAPEPKSVADLVFDVTEGTSSLIREEFELAKAEVSEKVGKILRGSAVGVAAGAFAFLALILIMEGIAWLLNEEVFDGKTWPGFFIEAAVFLLIAAAAGYFAYRSLKAGAPPLPEQAIEEAKLTRTMFEGEAERTAEGVQHSVVKGSGK
jgi:Putative Actinobacterial Holin-X, holin superfamily III